MAKNKIRKPSIRNKRINATKKAAREVANSQLGYMVARTRILKNRYRFLFILSILLNVGLVAGLAYAYATVILISK